MKLNAIFMAYCALWWQVDAQSDLDDDGDDFVENVDHLREHMKDQIDFNPDKMSRDEIQFYFFKIHDLDDDNQLDGLELFSAIRHGYEHIGHLEQRLEHLTKDGNMTLMEAAVEHYSRQVDIILIDDDINKDGYINYVEYSKARRVGMVFNQAGTTNLIHSKNAKG